MSDMIIGGNSRLYLHSETVGDGETSDPVLIHALAVPRSVEQLVVAVVCTTANVVQFTLDSPAAIAADTATWFDWSAGSVTENTVATLPREVTAVRCDNTGASDSTFKVSA